MHPILFKIPLFGGLPVYTYGALAAVGFLAGILWVVYESRRLGFETQPALDLSFYILVSAIIGSKVMFLLVTNPLRIIKEPWSIVMVWEGGLVFFGGLLAAVAVSLIYLKKKKMPLWTYTDIFAPAIALGHVFGRLGCLMVGCCYGSPTAGSPWYALTFPNDPATIAPSGVPLYPTQPMESLGELVIFFILVAVRRTKKFEGQVFALYLILYSLLRFFNEFLRGDTDRGFFVQNLLSTSQGISIALFVAGITLMIARYQKTKGGAERSSSIRPRADAQKTRSDRTLSLLMAIVTGVLLTQSCAKPLAEGHLLATPPVTKVFAKDANSIYYAAKWAMGQMGYPEGSEDLAGGVVESKWVPTTASSHYIDTVGGKDYGAIGAYYKLVITIVPVDNGENRVEIATKVKSLVNGVQSTGNKERELLAHVAHHTRSFEANVTNLGIED